MKRRLIAAIMTAAMAMSLLAGCGVPKSNSSGGSSGGSGDSGASGEKVFRFSTRTEPTTLDPSKGNCIPDTELQNALTERLVRNVKGEVKEGIAEKWEISDDGLVYTFHLRDAKWSDGEPLTADDVVFTYEEQNKQSENLFIGGEPIVLEKVDDLTVNFKLPSVCASAMEMLTSEASILPKHCFDGKGTFDINMLEEEVVGAGPYVLDEYQTGQHLKFTKNPNYANGEAKIDTIVYKVIENNDTATLALQNGEIDAWIGLPDLLDPYQDNESFNITNYSEGRVAYMRLNPKTANMQDKSYREGILYAMNREEIMVAAYTDKEFFDLGYSFLPPNNSYYSDDVEKWEQDLDKAKELTANGSKSLKLCYIEEDQVQTNQALTIQAELKAIGIEVELVGMNQAAYMKVAYDNENTEYDIYLGGYVMGVDPDLYSSLFVSSKDNMINYNSTEVDQLFTDGNATLDEAERVEIYKDVQRKVSEEAIFYPFGSNLRSLVTSARVGGLEEAKFVPIYTFGDLSKLELK